MKFEANMHVVTYCDTDSLLTFPVHPEAPKLNQLCQISDRLGCLKIEKDDVTKFFCTAAKTYSVETATGEVTIKAKGFRLLEKLLKDNSQECLLEKNITKMFMGVTECHNTEWTPSTLIFQKQIKVNPFEMVPALLPKEKSYKLLNFIGPRRQIDLENWLLFRYERICNDDYCNSKIDPLITDKSLSADQNNTRFVCNHVLTTPFDNNNSQKEAKIYSVQLVPYIKGVLPALPYGFDLKNVKNLLTFYALVL